MVQHDLAALRHRLPVADQLRAESGGTPSLKAITHKNHKAKPNENYARELQELFTLGVYDATGVANYTQHDIVQIARAFTGWSYDYPSGKASLDPTDHDFAAEFPERGAKVIYSTVGGFGPAGRDLTANGEREPEIDTVVDIIFEHTDSDGESTVGRRIARRLLEYFAHDSPTLADIDAVVSESGFATPGHPNQWSVQALCRAIFTHDVFYETSVPAPFTASTRKSVRWPIDIVIGTMRQLGVKPRTRYLLVGAGRGNALYGQLRSMGMDLLQPPSVFGWDWEPRWISSATRLARFQFANDIAYGRSGSSTGFHPDRVMDMSLTNAGDVVDAVTGVLCVTDQFTPAERDALIAYLTDGNPAAAVDLDDFDTVNQKLRGLFALVMQSPQYQQH